jgi:transcriptional regulator with XRE-family HTH domain
MLMNALNCRCVRRMMYLMADNDLGTRIRRARERMRWTQQQLADALSTPERRVALRSVGSWERGETVPRNSIGALEEVLHIDLSGAAEADSGEIEIRELAGRLGVDPAGWIDTYRANQRRAEPGRERAS